MAFSSPDKGANVLRWEGSENGRLILGGEGGAIGPEEQWQEVILLWGDVEISGKVAELKVLSGKALFLPGSSLDTKLTLMGGSYEAQGSAKVPMEKIEYKSPGMAWRALQREIESGWSGIGAFFQWLFWFLAIVLTWVIGRIVFALFPSLAKKGSYGLLRQGLANGFSAALGGALVLLGAIVLVVSLIGILLLPFYLLFAGFLLFVAYSMGALWLGHKILPPKKGKNVRGLGLLLGLVLLQVLWSFSFPITQVVALAILFLAFGSLLRTLRQGGR
jgi:hypothetical protein